MEQIRKNTVSSKNQLKHSEVISFPYGDGKGIRILFVGNSITRHAPSPDIGWVNDCGMAASDINKDYVHLIINRVLKIKNATFCIAQAAAWERKYKNSSDCFYLYQKVRDFHADVIIWRLIENCPVDEFDGTAFKQNVTDFLNFLNPSKKARIIITSGFWKHPGDSILKEIALEFRCPFIELGNLGEQEEMKAIGLFEHAGVANHPGDYGMQCIADKIWSRLQAIL